MGRLVLWPVGGVAAVLLIALIPPRPSLGTTVTAVAYVLYALLLLAGVFACRVAGITLADVVGSPPTGTRPWFTAALFGPLVLMFSAVSLWATVYVAASIAPGWAADQLAGRDAPMRILDRLGTTHRLLLVLNIIVFAPAVEEFVFRGMLLRRWLAKRGLWTGLLGSAAVFALLHPPIWIGSFVFGVIAGILYLWSGSLLVPILVHAINNAFVTLTVMAQESFPRVGRPTQTLTEFRSEWAAPLTMLLIIGASIVAVAWPLVRQVRDRMMRAAMTST